MNFEEYLIRLDELNRGMERVFKQRFPNLPHHVSKEILVNRISPRLGQTIDKLTATSDSKADFLSPTISMDDDTTIQTLDDIVRDPSLGRMINADWTQKPVLITVNPNSFSDQDKIKFMFFKFGMNPSSRVKSDASRWEIQMSKVRERGENNEPIVVLYDGGIFHMQEGWHRLMSYLASVAPQDQLDYLKNNQRDKVDFSLWPSVKLRAYVGKI